MNEYYWEIIEHDGTVTPIPPSAVEVVKRRWGNGDPIHVRTRSIPANQIKKFQITDRKFNAQPLLEAAAQAFDEPVLTDSGDIAVKWVKKNVPQDKWNRHFSAIHGYKYLGDFNGMATIAFRQPIHQIDTTKVEYCSQEEIQQLTGN